MIYTVCVSGDLGGAVLVEADNEFEAEDIAISYFHGEAGFDSACAEVEEGYGDDGMFNENDTPITAEEVE
ncbi:hypothetical protein LCGC14_1747760 [marine sediment metagenome]|uniref:Uncharacterized protein n=1 Tax=marine sediment metagenome TaxID=412755 RepID=A0A0F9HS60_9ZZZZ